MTLAQDNFTQRYLTVALLGQKLGGRSRSSILRDVEQKRLPKPIKIGSRLYWIEAEVDAVIAEQRAA